MTYTYRFQRPALTVDCVVFGLDDRDLKLLLIKRALNPFEGRWALPGGFVHYNETIDDAARRELKEETGITRLYLEQLYTFGVLNRDPRERVVSVAYYALVNLRDHHIRAETDARDVAWHPVSKLPALAFDHNEIAFCALARLKGKIHYEPLGFELLPEKFTLTQLQKLYETIWETELDKRNFRKKVLETDLLIELKEREKNVSHRAARLYRFNTKKYEKAKKNGYYFKV